MTEKCDLCNGTGKVHSHSDICWECDGRGVAEPAPPADRPAPGAPPEPTSEWKAKQVIGNYSGKDLLKRITELFDEVASLRAPKPAPGAPDIPALIDMARQLIDTKDKAWPPIAKLVRAAWARERGATRVAEQELEDFARAQLARAEAAEAQVAALRTRTVRACSCSTPDPVMQADGRFYCYHCSFQTGARPALLEPEDARKRAKQLEAHVAALTAGCQALIAEWADQHGERFGAPYRKCAALLKAVVEAERPRPEPGT